MEITDFFAQTASEILKQNHVIIFTGKNYSPFLFTRIIKHFEKTVTLPVKKVSIDLEISELSMSLATTFLGQEFVYVAGDLSSLSSKKKQSDWYGLLKKYQGPHRIVCFIETDDLEQHAFAQTIVRIQDGYTSDQVKKMPFLYHDQKPEVVAYFFSKLFALNKSYSLDQICLLQDYAGLLGKNMDQFFAQWVEKLITSEVSLFYLSQLFFEKNAEQFFVQWEKIRPYYSDQFWTAFFSEQLFKAYFYVTWQGKISTDQKQITFGLPFSFLKTDWKLYSTFELQVAHQKVYEIDLALKSGGLSYRLDSFFALFFAGNFS